VAVVVAVSDAVTVVVTADAVVIVCVGTPIEVVVGVVELPGHQFPLQGPSHWSWRSLHQPGEQLSMVAQAFTPQQHDAVTSGVAVAVVVTADAVVIVCVGPPIDVVGPGAVAPSGPN